MRTNWRTSLRVSAAIAALCGLAIAATGAAAPAEAPAKYRYESSWPKPLPNNWALGGITGIFVDQNDHI